MLDGLESVDLYARLPEEQPPDLCFVDDLPIVQREGLLERLVLRSGVEGGTHVHELGKDERDVRARSGVDLLGQSNGYADFIRCHTLVRANPVGDVEMGNRIGGEEHGAPDRMRILRELVRQVVDDLGVKEVFLGHLPSRGMHGCGEDEDAGQFHQRNLQRGLSQDGRVAGIDLALGRSGGDANEGRHVLELGERLTNPFSEEEVGR